MTGEVTATPGEQYGVPARAPIQGVAADISRQLRLLDKVVRYRFGDNAELIGAGESARNVAGSFQTKPVIKEWARSAVANLEQMVEADLVRDAEDRIRRR